MILSFSKNIEIKSNGTISWQAPSNIALVKYWGKFGNQLPSNPSISLTLSEAQTKTSLEWSYDPGQKECKLEFLFENKNNSLFTQRISDIVTRFSQEIPELNNFTFTFSSSNSFPHSAGIASSASGMAAFALCLTSCLREFTDDLEDETIFYKYASSLARQASGSACRSFFGQIVSWGEADGLDSSNEFSAPVKSSHKIFSTFCDSILILSSGEKSVSSSAGHKLMNSHPYSKIRFSHAKQNCTELLEVMRTGELTRFIEIVEEEALGLHGLMMTSNPSFILMNPKTLMVIEKVRSFRKESGMPLCFTLDAGPNIHLLYPESIKSEVDKFIEQELISYCEDGRIVQDRVGNGPKRR